LSGFSKFKYKYLLTILTTYFVDKSMILLQNPTVKLVIISYFAC